ncbi:MAG TPA: hypothetical protein VHF00_06490 [Acidimicrobiales bacterium]|nr:hypothetical protein [Acidimicrobiales bacterium]
MPEPIDPTPPDTEPEGDAVGHRVSIRAREIARRGPAALQATPTVEQFRRLSDGERRQVRRRLRVELYAIASMMADGLMRRALEQRPSYPPYGLARSMHSQMRMILATPGPVEEGSIRSFRDMGAAYVDTTVFHLDQYVKEHRTVESVWLLDRLEHLLNLYRLDEPALRARMRDGFSFLYGGLHFGTSVSVQLAEVMARLLEPTSLTAAEKAEVLVRSSRPAFHLAALNVAHVVPSHQYLLEGSASGGAPWMDPARFSVQEVDGRPWRIGLADEEFPAVAEIPTEYPTHGCPARVVVTGSTSAIGMLWTWCAELARDVGLLGEVEAPGGDVPADADAADADAGIDAGAADADAAG